MGQLPRFRARKFTNRARARAAARAWKQGYAQRFMKEDLFRHGIELACASGRKLQSQEHGFICLPTSPGSAELAIPIYENLLFCLALLRSKTHEAVFEAKKMLDRLFFFQQGFAEVESIGNFPLLISDYPYCRDHLHAVHCLHVLIWIQREFHHVLGHELLSRLTQVMHRLATFCLRSVVPLSLPVWARLKTACTLAAFAEIAKDANNPQLVEKAASLVPDLTDTTELRSWGDPVAIGEMILAYQLGSSIVAKEQWNSFWRYVFATWHTPSLSYCGPFYRVRHQIPSFYEYAMGLISGAYSSKANVSQAAALSCALLQRLSLTEEVSTSLQTGSNDRFSWGYEQLGPFALSYITGACRPDEMQGFYPFSLVAGACSLAIQPSRGNLSGCTVEGAKQNLIFTLPWDLTLDEKEKNYPIYIWFDDLKETDILVDGKRASCFRIHEPLQITLGDRQITLSFQVIKGDQEFVGHITRGSRSGLQVKMKEKIIAPDVQISLRVIRGSGPCEIGLNLIEK